MASPHLAPACDALHRDGHAVEQRKVPYEFQRGGDTMLQLQRG